MSPKLGPMTLGRHERLFFLEPEGSGERNFSEVSAEQVDSEIKRLMEMAQHTAESLLIEHQGLLQKVMRHLMEKEVVEGEAIAGWVREELSRKTA